MRNSLIAFIAFGEVVHILMPRLVLERKLIQNQRNKLKNMTVYRILI